MAIATLQPLCPRIHPDLKQMPTPARVSRVKVAELTRVRSQPCRSGFQLHPHPSLSSARVPITPNFPEDDNVTEVDPDNARLLDNRVGQVVPLPAG